MLFASVLVAAALGCALVSGFLLGFAVVVMPGLSTMDDHAFIRAFQVTDRVIQNRQPVFTLVWVGSVLAVLAAPVLGLGELDGGRGVLLVVAALVYLLGVQVPTAAVNISLNNAIQAVDVDTLNASQAWAAREQFEPRWNRWNAVRMAFGTLATLGLLVVLLWR